MLMSSRKRVQCVFCTFADSERLVPSISRYRIEYKSSFPYRRPSPYSNIRSFTSAHPSGLSRGSGRDSIPRRKNIPRPGDSSFDVSKIRNNLDRDRGLDKPRRHDGKDRDGKGRVGNNVVRRTLGKQSVPHQGSGPEMFEKLVLEQVRFVGLRLSMKNEYSGDTTASAWGITSDDELKERLRIFKDEVQRCLKRAAVGSTSREHNRLFYRLRHAFLAGSTRAMAEEMHHALLESVVSARLPRVDMESQKRLADLSHPTEWYPATRALHRTVHLHVGPTNSGKTYHALKKLEAANSGIYAGPLRLLAHEVYTRMNALGKKCALVTGEERRIPEGMLHGTQMSSCTVEMVPLNTTVDVAVIDEIQMMGDLERGWAWTQAFLGVKAREVHLCGEVRTVDLVSELCRKMGDKLVIHRYERLSPLETSSQSLDRDLGKLEKGDAVILFSRVGIHAMKAAIEARTRRRCAVVYGGLPPETRAQQAALFNDPDNDYDYLVASDAVGMGLNLSIKRVIFESVSKHNGSGGFKQLQISEIKQIGGRAGRYKTARDAIVSGVDCAESPPELDIVKRPDEPTRGFVTTLDALDLPVVRAAMQTDVEQLKLAGILPPGETLARFATYFPPETPFSYIVLRLHDLTTHEKTFQLCRLKDQLEIADIIQQYKLSSHDRITFMAAPVALRENGFAEVVKELAACVANQEGGELLDLKTVQMEFLNDSITQHRLGSKGYLKQAEFLHKVLTLYLWLSYRFSGIFRSQALAFHVKALTEEKIDECLAEVKWDSDISEQAAVRRRQSALSAAAQAEQAAKEAENSTASVESADVEAGENGESGVVIEAEDADDSPSTDANIPAPFDIEEGGEEKEKEVDEVGRDAASALEALDELKERLRGELGSQELSQPQITEDVVEESEGEEVGEAAQDPAFPPESMEDPKNEAEVENTFKPSSIEDSIEEAKLTDDTTTEEGETITEDRIKSVIESSEPELIDIAEVTSEAREVEGESATEVEELAQGSATEAKEFKEDSSTAAPEVIVPVDEANETFETQDKPEPEVSEAVSPIEESKETLEGASEPEGEKSNPSEPEEEGQSKQEKASG